MNRSLATLRYDIVLQFRNGFYHVSVFFIAIWVGLWSQLPNTSNYPYALILPALVTLNMLITTFYFVAGLVLLEKAEGTLTSLVVTPLRAEEYLVARVLSLSLLAALESLLIVVLIYGFHFNPLPLVVGMLLLGGFYTLAGFVAIVRYDSINAYVIPSGFVVLVLLLPLIDHVGLWRHPIFYLHPLQPALLLLRAAFEPPASWQIAYGLGGSLLWFTISFAWAHRIFHRFAVRTAGE